MEILITSNKEYIEALKGMDDAYRLFVEARKKADDSAGGSEHYTNGTDEYLFNRFLEKKRELDEIAKRIKSDK